jgi:serine/threonine protein kinase
MTNSNYRYQDGKIELYINGSWIEPVFKDYDDIKPIGEPGANGVVLKGTHKITKREDAIKVWLPRKRNGKFEIREDQYLAEIQKITKLNDPRIATIYNAWTENGCYCCSMELINGITFEQWREENRDPYKRINILLKIFETIIFYQSHGIIHGDIHSRNILIDKDEKIHVIDFGTSSLSAYKEQSIHRENYLMYELVEKTVEELFDKNAFLYNKYEIHGAVKKPDDIRKVIPIFFSRSVLCYLQLLIMKHNSRDIINQPELLYEYCRYIAKGHYINMNYFYLNVSGKNIHKMDLFSRLMFESLEDEIYEDCQYNTDKAEKITFISLFVYFERIKKDLKFDKLNGEILKKHLSDENIRLINNSYNLFEFHGALLDIFGSPDKVYSIEINIRESLNNILEESYGDHFLYLIRDINLRIDEIKLDNELCDRIYDLSYILCANNGKL